MRKIILVIYGLLVLVLASGCGITKGSRNAVGNNTENVGYEENSNSEKIGVYQNVDYQKYKNADELVGSTDLVFSGTVYEKRCELLDERMDKSGVITDEEKTLCTVYGVYIDKVYKGDIEQDIVYVAATGGELEKNNRIYSGETVNLDIDNKYLFFASDYSDYGEEYLKMVNVHQSAYSMDDESNKKRITAVGNNSGITLSEIFEVIGK
ncbi:MAG: hypothetical protein HFH67_16190 [Lachnospiraceae bacterium]|nr:hypothetical protein [Lachnospiraceae bacterium]